MINLICEKVDIIRQLAIDITNCEYYCEDDSVLGNLVPSDIVNALDDITESLRNDVAVLVQPSTHTPTDNKPVCKKCAEIKKEPSVYNSMIDCSFCIDHPNIAAVENINSNTSSVYSTHHNSGVFSNVKSLALYGAKQRDESIEIFSLTKKLDDATAELAILRSKLADIESHIPNDKVFIIDPREDDGEYYLLGIDINELLSTK